MKNIKCSEVKAGMVVRSEYGDFDNWVTARIIAVDTAKRMFECENVSNGARFFMCYIYADDEIEVID